MALATKIKTSADIYVILLTPSDVSSGFIFLPGVLPADQNRILVDVIALGPQVLNVDYIIIGNRLDWNALGMQTVLSAGDRLRIMFLN